MGAIGTKLYDNDFACDVRDEYIEYLKEGKNNIEATQKVIDSLYDGDIDDTPIFWFALADTQWKYGRLLNEVKVKAIYYINQDLEAWKDDQKTYEKRQQILNKLKEQLESPQPKEKRIVIPKPFITDWKDNDVFYYKLESNYAKEKGLYEQYLIIHKIDEFEFGKDILPIFRVKITSNKKVPTTVEEINKLEYVQISVGSLSLAYSANKLPIPSEEELKGCYDEYGILPEFKMTLSFISKRSIPKSLEYLGNFNSIEKPKIEFVEPNNFNTRKFAPKFFEEIIIDKYFKLNKRQCGTYTNVINKIENNPESGFGI